MSRKEYRVGWRRAGWKETQHKVFGLEPAARRFIEKLEHKGGNPIAEVSIEERECGPWVTIWPPAPLDSACQTGGGCCIHGLHPDIILEDGTILEISSLADQSPGNL